MKLRIPYMFACPASHLQSLPRCYQRGCVLTVPNQRVSQECEAKRQEESCSLLMRFHHALPDQNNRFINVAQSDQRRATHNRWLDKEREPLLGNKSLGAFQPFEHFIGLTVA